MSMQSQALHMGMKLFRACENNQSPVARERIEEGYRHGDTLASIQLYALQGDQEAALEVASNSDVTECDIANAMTYCKRWGLQWSPELVA